MKTKTTSQTSPPSPRLTLVAVKLVAIACGLAILTPLIALAQPWYIPTSQIESITLVNDSDEAQALWIAAPADPAAPFDEVSFQLNPHETKNYILGEEKKFPWIQVKTYEQVPVRVFAYTKTGKIEINPGRSENIVSFPFLNKVKGTLVLINLSPISQDGIILSTSPRSPRDSTTELSLGQFAAVEIPMTVERANKIYIKASYPVAALFISDDGLNSFYGMKSNQLFKTKTLGSYFQMVNWDHTQSFIFYSEDQNIIESSRKQIQDPDLRRILFAKIGKGHGETNRDLTNTLKIPWSWNVTEATGYGDFGIPDCNGSPQIVEDLLLPWLQADQNICFWGYRILRELTAFEVETGFQETK